MTGERKLKSKRSPFTLQKDQTLWAPYWVAHVFRLHLVVWLIAGGVTMYFFINYFLRDAWGIQFPIEKTLFIAGSTSLLALPILDRLFYREVSVRYWEAGMKNRPRMLFIPPWFEFYPVMAGTTSVVRKFLGYLLAFCYVLAPVCLGGAMSSAIFF